MSALVSYHLRRLGSRLHRMRIALHVRGLAGLLRRMREGAAGAGAAHAGAAPMAGMALPAGGDGGAARRRFLLIDTTTPRPDRDSGSLRAYNLMRLLRADGHAVDFLPDDGQCAEGYADALRALGVTVHCGPRDAYPRWFAKHLPGYDALVVSRYHLAEFLLPLARHIAPGVHLVLDTIDLHHVREEREAAIRGDSTLHRLSRSTRRRELAAVAAADTTWVVSPFERTLLAQALPGAHVEVLPNIHEPAAHAPGFDLRRDLLFVGGAGHPPNVDAATWLLEDIFPRIRDTLPDCDLHLAGDGLSRLPAAGRARPGVVVHDHVPDLAPLLDTCRIGLAPLRYGAGVKGKVNLYMAHGMPVVATNCAAEGMHLQEGDDVLLADDADSLAAAVVRLYRDAGLWQSLVANGGLNIQRHFSFDAAREAIAATFAPHR